MEIREKLWLLGPGRRSENTVFEQQFLFDAQEQTALQQSGKQLPKLLQQKLAKLAIVETQYLDACDWNTGEVAASFGRIFSCLSIMLQRAAGHQVSEFGSVEDGQGQGAWVWFEYEHDAVAAAAAVLSFHWLAELEPALRLPDLDGEAVELQDLSWPSFCAMAESWILSTEAAAILQAAQVRGVPCVKLERPPYKGVEGAFRIRQNGLLKLGHCAHQLIVDGSICVNRHVDLLPLLHNPGARRARLAALNLPLPVVDPAAGNCALTKHALRSAERIGYPLVLHVTASNGQRYSWPGINNAENLRSTLDTARRYGTQVELEGSVSGDNWQILLVGTGLIALLKEGQVQIDRLHAETRLQIEQIARDLASGALLLEVRTSDITQPLSAVAGAFLDFDLAPRLDELLKNCPEYLSGAATSLVDFLFPPGSKARIPIASVTGTNGKTTTSRMMETIARDAGLVTGMVNSDGIIYSGKQDREEGKGGFGRQFRLFEREDVQFAVLEEYFGSIVRAGFAYDFSDVAVCTNVTEDHLGRIGVHSMADMAATKALVVRRARKAAVLNADNSYSLGMMGTAQAENIGLISLKYSAAELQALLDRPGKLCIREVHNGEPWLVVYQDNVRTPLMREIDLPTSYAGKAAHNTANAMQAALAGIFLGFSLEQIRSTLASFKPEFETAAGRLNIMEGLPFQFIMDYAHNLDGFRVLTDFVQQLVVDARKILCVAFSGDRQNREIQQAISILAGHFDLYICRSYRGLRGRDPAEIPRLIASCLQQAGVPSTAVQVELDPMLAIDAAIAAAGPGDLLVVLAGSTEFQEVWNKVTELKAKTTAGIPSTRKAV